VNNHWSLLGADLGMLYYCPNGSIAGIADLEANASLISNPINPIRSLNDGIYSPAICALFNHSSYQFPETDYDPRDPPVLPSVFTYPLGNYYTINQSITIPNVYSSGINITTMGIALHLPSLWQGTLTEPLEPIYISGDYTLSDVNPPSDFTGDYINNSNRAFVGQFTIATYSPVTVTYLLNPLVFSFDLTAFEIACKILYG
jgi:hypothetical protein